MGGVEQVEEPPFDAATAFVEQNASKLSETVLLKLYGYFKQATQGPCTDQKRPGIFDFKGRSKYDAWVRVGQHVTQDEAKFMYVNELTSAIPDWREAKKQAHGPVFSMPVAAEDSQEEEFPMIIRHVQQGELDALVSLIETCPTSVDDRDAEGCTALHWAADKGNCDMVRVLVQHGADVNAVDIDGQRPLEYAMAMSHTEEEQAYLESALA